LGRREAGLATLRTLEAIGMAEAAD